MKSKIKNEVVDINATIDEWVRKLVHGTVFQTETEMYNKLQGMVIELKNKLGGSSVPKIESETKVDSDTEI